MFEDLIILAVGAVIGFISNIALQLVQGKVDKLSSERERRLDSKQEREKNIRAFLTRIRYQGIAPAWVSLIKTTRPFLFPHPETMDTRSFLPHLQALFKKSNADNKIIAKFLLTQTQIIGRQEDCEIRLSDSSVSRLHAIIRYEDGRFVIYDFSSKSGTFVNNTKVEKDGITLYRGNEIKTGRSVFVFEGDSIGIRKSEDTTSVLIETPTDSKLGIQKARKVKKNTRQK